MRKESISYRRVATVQAPRKQSSLTSGICISFKKKKGEGHLLRRKWYDVLSNKQACKSPLESDAEVRKRGGKKPNAGGLLLKKSNPTVAYPSCLHLQKGEGENGGNPLTEDFLVVKKNPEVPIIFLRGKSELPPCQRLNKVTKPRHESKDSEEGGKKARLFQMGGGV